MTRFAQRSGQLEWMDTEDVSTADFAACLADLAAVNTMTLARQPTIAFMRRVARHMPGQALSVLDVGFGEGDMLRRVARWGARRGQRLELAGIDLDPSSTAAAIAATPPPMGIRYQTGDVFDLQQGEVDVVISSLFTHHLTDDQVVAFLKWMEARTRRGWFINDLHRHPLAYYGFRALSAAARWHPMVQHDGPISVTRAFRRRDWITLLRRAGLDGVAAVGWHMPFRFCVTRLK